MAFHNIPPNGFPNIPDMEELEAVVKDVASVKTSVAGLTTDVSNLSDNKANQITIAPFFDPEASYEVGDLVYYNGLSYRCTNDHEGEWDADDFAATTIAGELDSLKIGLSNLEKNAMFSAVDISSYSDANPYTTPSDGYLYVNNGSGQTARVLIGDGGYASVGGYQGKYSVFIRKGIKLLPSGTADSIKFAPLT